MNSRLIDDTDEHEERASRGADREITLGTTTILLIFFALAASHAAVFGFGFSLGGRHNATSTTGVEQAPASSGSFNAFKPAPGSPVGAASTVKLPTATETATVPIAPPPAAVKVDMPVAKAPAETADADDAALRSRTAPAAAAPVAAPANAAAPSAVPVAGFGTVVVQVAAVSHQEDADLIASTLKRRGYVVNIRTEADKLLHVQVGPFATRKDAETMKAKLLADGFNAYIK